jgi:UDP-N-acetylmuramyl tripeptide synthase
MNGGEIGVTGTMIKLFKACVDSCDICTFPQTCLGTEITCDRCGEEVDALYENEGHICCLECMKKANDCTEREIECAKEGMRFE